MPVPRGMTARLRRSARTAGACLAAGAISLTAGACSGAGEVVGAASSRTAPGHASPENPAAPTPEAPRTGASEAADPWLGKADVSVFLCISSDPRTGGCTGGEVTAAQRDTVETRLRSLRQVEQVWYESREEAFRSFMSRFRGTSLAQSLTPDQVPESFRVKLISPFEGPAVAAWLSDLDGVAAVVPIGPLGART